MHVNKDHSITEKRSFITICKLYKKQAISRIMHPLEGEYILYEYGEQDYAGEGWGLALFQMVDGKMIELFNPKDELSFWAEAPELERTIETLMERMRIKGISRVYTVNHTRKWKGIPGEFFSLHEPDTEPDQIELWAEYRAVTHWSTEGRYRELLRENNIELREYDVERE
jgi:hypothetical protein